MYVPWDGMHMYSRNVIIKLIPYIANRSRWKSFADGQGITNSLENFRGLLTPVNLKETRSHIRTLFNTTKYRRTVLDRFRTRLCRLLTGLHKGNLSPSVSVAGGLCHTKSRNMHAMWHAL